MKNVLHETLNRLTVRPKIEEKRAMTYLLCNIYSPRVSQNALWCSFKRPVSQTRGLRQHISLNDPESFDQLRKSKRRLNSAHKHLLLGLLFRGFLRYGWHSANFLWKSSALWAWNAATHDR